MRTSSQQGKQRCLPCGSRPCQKSVPEAAAFLCHLEVHFRQGNLLHFHEQAGTCDEAPCMDTRRREMTAPV